MPIIPDEARTFGIDALFAEFKIYAPFGQLYEPVDAGLMLSYREAEQRPDPRGGHHRGRLDGVVHRRGTSYATWGQPMIPFFIFYSMFGFQRVGDLIWSFGDQRGRGFLLGATAGRTTLTGEGLQHCDGQSHVQRSAYPELPRVRPGVRVRDRRDRARRHRAHVRRRSRGLLLLPHALQRELSCPAMPDGVEEGIVRGMYRFRTAPEGQDVHRADPRQRHRGCWRRSTRSRCSRSTTTSGPTCGACRGSSSRDDALDVERWNRLHPAEPPRAPYVTEQLRDSEGPVVAVTDWVKAVPDAIARFVPRPYVVLGTDGYGFSDTRAALRRHFEVDAAHVVVAALDGLANRRRRRTKR